MADLKKIALIGAGNVAHHLGKHLVSNGIIINQVFNRSPKNGKALAQKLNAIYSENLTFIEKDTDLLLVCVSDDEIASVVKSIPEHFKVAYTSGSIQLNSLPQRKYLGVFYPLQTFTKERKVSMNDVPFFIESTDADFGNQLFKLAQKLSLSVQYANSEHRFQLHIAAVMVNNFVNHIYTLANEHLERHQLSIDLLLPLIEETTAKLKFTKPIDAQTGPAKRNDQAVIQKHLLGLTGSTKEIYALLSQSIQEKHSKK